MVVGSARAVPPYGVSVQPVTHTFAVQMSDPVHVPHDATVRLVPQLSLAVTLPQFLPSRVQNATSLSAVQPHTLATGGVAPAHVCGAVHVPQFTVLLAPQLSLAVTLSQFLPS